jgi:hypothetical protein
MPPALGGGLPGLFYTRYHEIAAVMRLRIHPVIESSTTSGGRSGVSG